MKTDELDRLVAAGTIKEIDGEHVRFIVRRIVQPPERPDDPLLENVMGSFSAGYCVMWKPRWELFASDKGVSRTCND
jgi:hypothetical protein